MNNGIECCCCCLHAVVLVVVLLGIFEIRTTVGKRTTKPRKNGTTVGSFSLLTKYSHEKLPHARMLLKNAWHHFCCFSPHIWRATKVLCLVLVMAIWDDCSLDTTQNECPQWHSSIFTKENKQARVFLPSPIRLNFVLGYKKAISSKFRLLCQENEQATMMDTKALQYVNSSVLDIPSMLADVFMPSSITSKQNT